MASRFPDRTNLWHCPHILNRFDQNFEWINEKGTHGSKFTLSQGWDAADAADGSKRHV